VTCVAVLGSGSLARAICESLAVVASRPTTVAVLARTERAVEVCHIAGLRAVLSGTPVTFRPMVADLADQAVLAGLFAEATPAGIVLCASTHSPWERLTAPSRWTELIGRAGFGVTVPLHAELALVVGRAAAQACPRAWYLNGCFPDAVNAVLVAHGLPVLAGIGNVALLASALQAALGLPDQERLAVLGHHLHLDQPDRLEDELLAWTDGVPVTGVGELLAVPRTVSRPRLTQITGHAGALLISALLDGVEVSTHLPGPAGRPGGYPVRIGPSAVALRLPPGLSEAEAIATNQRWAAADGVVVDGTGVRFSTAAAALLHPHVPGEFAVDQIADVAASMHELRGRLRRQTIMTERSRQGRPACDAGTRLLGVGAVMGLNRETPTMSHATANLILDFYDELSSVLADRVQRTGGETAPGNFSPGFGLPALTDELLDFYAVGTATWHKVAAYSGHEISLLDLTGNPGTHTTKTFPSLLIVARAVEHIRRTGERVMIFSPTSANKGVALRDAVLRAIRSGLVEPDQLRIVTLAPVSCRAKLRASELSTEPHLRELNPLLLYLGDDREAVKAIGRQFVTEYAEALFARRKTNVWFSLELTNYLVADTARAFFELRADPIEGALRPRLHAHAVSSAFGLLGYHAGRQVLEANGDGRPECRPSSLIVQHLGAPDMVLNLRNGDFDRRWLPAYTMNARTGLQHQIGNDPRFPEFTYDPCEVLDPTFYTHQPATSPAMNAIIAKHGGDGIVVSLAECVARYPLVRSWLADGPRTLPADFRTLQEWSTVMAFTGVLNAIDRGLVDQDRDIVVHGTGHYTTADVEPLDPCAMTSVRDVADVADALLRD
jgi:Family of unknown function (DUF6002)